MAGMRGIDFAQYTVVPSAQQWAAIDRDGYGDFVIIAVGDLNRARRNAQIESAMRAGKRPEGYIYDHMGHAEQQTTEAIENIRREGYDIPFLWHDIEETRGYSPSQVVASLQECVRLTTAAGWPRADGQGIYTGGWIWPQATGNSNAFADMALWTAFYNTDAAGGWLPNLPIDFTRFQPYGGWGNNIPRPTRRDTRQYRGTYNLHGVNSDLNWRDAIWKDKGDDMTRDEVLALLASNDAWKALKQAPIDYVDAEGKVLKAGEKATLDLVLHRLKDLRSDDSGGSVDPETLARIIGKALQDAGAALNP